MKKTPTRKSTNHEEESRFSSDSKWRHEYKFNPHKPLGSPHWSWPKLCGSLCSHRTPALWFFQIGRNQDQLHKDVKLAQQWVKAVLWRSPESWGLHCGPTYPCPAVPTQRHGSFPEDGPNGSVCLPRCRVFIMVF